MSCGRAEARLRKLHTHIHALSAAHARHDEEDVLSSQPCCGIVGYVGKREALSYLVDGLTTLQNRGYDSAGIASLADDGALRVVKFASTEKEDSIVRLQRESGDKLGTFHVGIAHTRWATHGAKTDENAHPHTDQSERVALVHNGTIYNADAIKEQLQKEHQIKFRSDTDSEVIAQLIGVNLDKHPSFIDAVRSALGELEGTWGLVILNRQEPDRLYVACNGSPILIGLAPDGKYIASEDSAFVRHTRSYIVVQNGEVLCLTGDGEVDRARVLQAAEQKIETSPAPHPHWTIKEILEQPEAVARSLNFGGRFRDSSRVLLGGLDRNANALLAIRHLVIVGCGTSMFAAKFGASLMRKIGSFDTVQVIDAGEMGPESLPADGGGVLAISQSGETKDVHRAVMIAQQAKCPCFSVVNAVGSLIARTTGLGVYINAGREVAVASTKAFMCQSAVLSLIAVWFAEKREGADELPRKRIVTALQGLPTYIGMTLRQRPLCASIAQRIIQFNSVFVLGKGPCEAIAYEAALKIKEITYIHAEGYSGSALKHGPFALISDGMPIFFIVLDDEHCKKMLTAVSEVKARGAFTVIVTDCPSRIPATLADMLVPVESNGPMSPVLCMVPFQLIAYEAAVLRGINPDKPRHLAKAVTVD